jgi:hypothetical protein
MAEAITRVEAFFDGTVLHPETPLELAPNTRVRVVIEAVLPPEEEPPSVLDVALSLNLDGPPDWAKNIDRYLYGNPGLSEHERSGDAE